MQIFKLPDQILLPIAPSILGAIANYLESIAGVVGDRAVADDDGKDAERSQNLSGQKKFDSDSHGVAATSSAICAESIKITHTIQYQYRSTFAHRLAAKFNFTPIEICHQLQPRCSQNQSELAIECWYDAAGYIFFEVSATEISRWLDYIGNSSVPNIPQSADRHVNLSRSTLDLSIYAYARCHSILELARTQQLITLTNNWQIAPAKHHQEQHERGSLIVFNQSSERYLIRSLMTVLDAIYSPTQLLPIAERDPLLALNRAEGSCSIRSPAKRLRQIATRTPNWQKLTLDLAGCWLNFYRDCRIFGDLQRQNPHLAIARCGLTAIVRRYLQLLLEDYLGVEAVREL